MPSLSIAKFALPLLLTFTGLLPAATVTLVSSANPAVFGQAITLTATVTPSTATGTVTFYAGTSLLGTKALAGGQAVLSAVLLPFGATSLRANYNGDATNPAVASALLAQSVTTLASSGFLMPVNYGVGSFPQGLAIGDVNGDGLPDLVTANGNFGAVGTVSVLLGKGDGTYQNAVTYNAGTGPSAIALGDFNGDGQADLAVANVSSGDVSVLLGKGDGTFQTAVSFGAGASPRGLVVSDVNQDGIPDLVVANNGDQTVSVLLGKGDGTFRAAVSYAAGLGPQGLTVGDFNGDGKADLAVADYGPNNGSGGSVSVLLGNGDGTFQTPVSYTPGLVAFGVSVGDFNGDGKADLAVANAGSNNVSVLLGNGDGTFKTAVNYSVDVSPRAVAIGDFNGDGKTDLAVASYFGGVSLLLGNGDGTFQPAVSYAAGAGPVSLVAGDFNRDGVADLAAVSYLSGNVSVLLGKPATATPSISAVVNAASSQDGLASGAWISIYGSNLSATTRAWAQSDFVNNALPTALDGVKVNINGKPAYVYYISPNQLNVLAPNDATTGPVTVEVTTVNAAQRSPGVTVNKRLVAPAFFVYSQQSGKYAIAQDGSSFALLGPAGLLGTAATIRPATAGQVITLYATGLGDTSPSYPDGQIIQTPAPLPALPQVLIGGVAANVQFAGLIGPGLYQINAVVPAAAAGDASVTVVVNGASSPAGVFLSLQ